MYAAIFNYSVIVDLFTTLNPIDFPSKQIKQFDSCKPPFISF